MLWRWHVGLLSQKRKERPLYPKPYFVVSDWISCRRVVKSHLIGPKHNESLTLSTECVWRPCSFDELSLQNPAKAIEFLFFFNLDAWIYMKGSKVCKASEWERNPKNDTCYKEVGLMCLNIKLIILISSILTSTLGTVINPCDHHLENFNPHFVL